MTWWECLIMYWFFKRYFCRVIISCNFLNVVDCRQAITSDRLPQSLLQPISDKLWTWNTNAVLLRCPYGSLFFVDRFGFSLWYEHLMLSLKHLMVSQYTHEMLRFLNSKWVCQQISENTWKNNAWNFRRNVLDLFCEWHCCWYPFFSDAIKGGKISADIWAIFIYYEQDLMCDVIRKMPATRHARLLQMSGCTVDAFLF